MGKPVNFCDTEEVPTAYTPSPYGLLLPTHLQNLQQDQGKHQAHTFNDIHAVGVLLYISTLLC